MFTKSKLKLLVLIACLVIANIIALVPKAASAVLSDGAAATNALGQYDWVDTSNLAPLFTSTSTVNRIGYNTPTAVAVDSTNNRLFVADSANNRILVYGLNSDGILVDHLADNVLGQANFYSGTDGSGEPSATNMGFVSGMVYDPTANYLYAADSTTNRIAIYDVASISNGEAAVHVLGQPDLVTNVLNGVSDVETSNPTALALDVTGRRLFVADTGYNRVLVFDITAITDGEAAVNVLGQSDFTSETGARTQSRLNQPSGLAYDATGNRLFVGDMSNHRVLTFDVAAITNGENATSVLGQTTYTAGTSGLTQAKFNLNNNTVVGLSYVSTGSRLFVGDTNNRRVMVFDVAAITNGEAAVNVLGQANFTTNTGVYTQASTYLPQGLATGGASLYVADASARRIMVFDVAAVTDGEDASNLLGQTDGLDLTDPAPLYTASGANAFPNRWFTSSPHGVAVDGINHRLYVTASNAILVYNLNSDNTLVDRLPDAILGQPDFTTFNSGLTNSTVNNPFSIAIDPAGHRLFVADTNNNRILVFDVTTISNGEAAVNVLGQPDMTTSNATAPTATGIAAPYALAFDEANQRLFVSSDFSRVLVFDVASIADGEAAVAVLGRSDFTDGSCGTTACGAGGGAGLAYDAARQFLFVSMNSGAGVRVFDVTSITNGEDAINVIGTPDFETYSSGLTDSTFNGPVRGLTYDADNKRLFVADGNPSIGASGSRVLVFDVATITNGESAINVLGQADFTSNNIAVTASGMNSPFGLTYDATTSALYVTDDFFNRVTIFDAAVNGFSKSTGNLTVTEGAASGTFTVRLSGAPSTDVVISVSSADDSVATVSPSTLTFTSGNWNTPQTVTVTAAEDANTTRDATTVLLSIVDDESDDSFDAVDDQTVTITVNDNDQPTQTGGGGSSSPPPVTPTTPLAPSLISPPPTTDNTTPEPNTPAEEQLEDQPTVCSIPKYPTTFIKFGSRNNPEEVKLLEQFLNLFMGFDLPVNGIYEQADRQAIIAFQEKYTEDILAPWKLKKGTGYIYTKTLAKIKQLVESRCQ
jgi:DNA-binding beta-propeller fold protein YncE